MSIDEILAAQDGVISRRQVLAAGEKPHAIERRLRRREWATVHPGVYVDHTGPVSWQQRAWAALLVAGPGAALCLESALRAHEGKGRRGLDETVIHVAVPRDLTPAPRAGVRFHRMAGLSERVQWNRSPPRTAYDDTVLDLAAQGSALDSVARLADPCGTRRTTAARLLARLDQRSRIAQREWLRAVLADVAEGTCSVLEHGYLDLIERPHGLPVGQRQAPRLGSNGRIYVDVDHTELGVRIELDGRLFHSSTEDRDRDLERDLDAAVGGTAATLRLGFGQVYERPCSTAVRVGAVLARHRWTGEIVRCDACRDAA